MVSFLLMIMIIETDMYAVYIDEDNAQDTSQPFADEPES